MMSLCEQLLARLPASASQDSRHSLNSAFMIEAGYRKKAEEIKADGRLSAEGKAEKLAELKTATLSNGHLTQIRTLARKQLDGIKSERETFRAAVLKRPDDPFAEQRNSEIRAMLRSMSESERIKMALAGDPEITDAVMLANPVLSGVPAFIHAEIVEKVVATRHQTRGAELATQQEEAETIAAAVQVVDDMISRS
jgi:hypothetical protein